MEGLKECVASLVVYLHPSQSNCADKAILGELSSLLFTYNETFEGVVLAYDPNIVSNLGKILPGLHPYFGVKLKAKLLLFSPKPDMLLEGEVVRITSQSIHAVVLGFSSVSIVDEDIRGEFKYKDKQGKEAYVSRSNKNHKIKVGTIIRFTVKGFHEDVLHISGSLAAENTGSVRWLDRSQAVSPVKRIKEEAEHEKWENHKLVSKSKLSSLGGDEQVKRAKKRRKEHS